MSVNTVHDALLDILQKNTALDTEFATALTGTVTSTGTTLDGTNTLFLAEVAVDDYVGNPTVGYRRVMSVVSNVKLTVAAIFDAALVNASIKSTEIKKGIATIEDITSVGKKLRVAFDSSTDIDLEVAKRAGVPVSLTGVLGEYRFTVALIFSEPNVINIDERKGNYDKWIRDAIDPNLTINKTCVGITEMSTFAFIDHPEDDNIHLGAMAVICFPKLIRGAR